MGFTLVGQPCCRWASSTPHWLPLVRYSDSPSSSCPVRSLAPYQPSEETRPSDLRLFWLACSSCLCSGSSFSLHRFVWCSKKAASGERQAAHKERGSSS